MIIILTKASLKDRDFPSLNDALIESNMGNKVVRCDFVLPVKQPRLSTYLTTEQIYLVQHSWELIKDDLSKLGIIVFLR